MKKGSANRNYPELIWRKFDEQPEPQARFYLRQYRQKDTENIDDFWLSAGYKQTNASSETPRKPKSDW